MKFVSFKEAVQANLEGRTVASWLDSETMPYNVHYQKYDELSKGIKIDRFVLMGEELSRFDELKWTISE